eukprot:gene6167-6797_t
MSSDAEAILALLGPTRLPGKHPKADVLGWVASYNCIFIPSAREITLDPQQVERDTLITCRHHQIAVKIQLLAKVLFSEFQVIIVPRGASAQRKARSLPCSLTQEQAAATEYKLTTSRLCMNKVQ